MAKGRRDKKDSTAKVNNVKKNNSISSNTTPSTNFHDQLDRASAQLQMAGQRIGQLHSTWKSYLSGLSYIVIYLSFYQLRNRTNACNSHLEMLAKERQQQQPEQEEETTMSRWTTKARLMGLDAAALLVGLVLAILHCIFLRSCANNNSVVRFSHPIFLTAQLCAVTATILYWIRTAVAITTSTTESDQLIDYNHVDHHHQLSCLDPSIWTDEMRTIIVATATQNNDDQKIPFPCAIVFHFILALSLWFMNYQRQQHVTNATRVDSLRNELRVKQQQQRPPPPQSGDTKKTK